MEFKIGHAYRCLPVELENEVVGVITKVYENTVMILVEEYSKKDRVAVLDKHQLVIVRKPNVFEEILEKAS